LRLLWKLLVALSNIGAAPSRAPRRPTQPVSRSELHAPAPTKTVSADDCWIDPGHEVTVAGVTISGGMLYVGKGLLSVAGHSVEPALIDPSLPVARATSDHSGSTMGYWPSYSGISPQCRAAYLDWLVRGRRNPSASIGYVFLFFYGLERRALADAPRSSTATQTSPRFAERFKTFSRFTGRMRRFIGMSEELLSLDYASLQLDMEGPWQAVVRLVNRPGGAAGPLLGRPNHRGLREHGQPDDGLDAIVLFGRTG
jgi:hypothetical protein